MRSHAAYESHSKIAKPRSAYEPLSHCEVTETLRTELYLRSLQPFENLMQDAKPCYK